jgi:1,4-alpha-glucan branching enzyme
LAQGYLMLVLHNHLPFIRHPEHESFLEERWLFEASLETYLPILYQLDRLQREGVDYQLTLSFSPTLLSMLNDRLLQNRFMKHVEKLLELGEKELKRTVNTAVYPLALMYKNRLTKMYRYYREQGQGNIINLLRDLRETGKVELITCPATHGFLPFMREEAVEGQIAAAISTYRRFFNESPPGMWLGECAYVPGIERILKKYGIKYFFLDSHGVVLADPSPGQQGVYAPIQCPNETVVFGRDWESSKQVWSKEEGYPGDYYYREYYRDIGFDLPFEYIKPYIHPDGIRLNTGFKYHRITGRTNYKELYDPEAAREKAAVHGGNFMFNKEKQIRHLSSVMDRKPVLVAPYDGELFGHWWYEGPLWLNFLLRKIHYDQDVVKTISPSSYLQLYSDHHQAQPAMSSWGDKGYFEVWLNSSNHWIYRHLHRAADYMVELADDWPEAEGKTKLALTQAARELLLAQASDWAFIMNSGTMVEYAHRKTVDHLGRFFKIYGDIKEGKIDDSWLKVVAHKDNLFPELDYKVYTSHN